MPSRAQSAWSALQAGSSVSRVISVNGADATRCHRQFRVLRLSGRRRTAGGRQQRYSNEQLFDMQPTRRRGRERLATASDGRPHPRHILTRSRSRAGGLRPGGHQPAARRIGAAVRGSSARRMVSTGPPPKPPFEHTAVSAAARARGKPRRRPARRPWGPRRRQGPGLPSGRPAAPGHDLWPRSRRRSRRTERASVPRRQSGARGPGYPAPAGGTGGRFCDIPARHRDACQFPTSAQVARSQGVIINGGRSDSPYLAPEAPP